MGKTLLENKYCVDITVNTDQPHQQITSVNTDDVDQLHQQITCYQEEIQQFDAIKSDLQSEKEALEGVLVNLRGLLKEKENDLKQVNNELTKRETDFETLKKEKVRCKSVAKY